MKISIIGTANIGTMLIRKLAQAGHSIQMANSREPESLKELAEETGAKALTGIAFMGAERLGLNLCVWHTKPNERCFDGSHHRRRSANMRQMIGNVRDRRC